VYRCSSGKKAVFFQDFNTITEDYNIIVLDQRVEIQAKIHSQLAKVCGYRSDSTPILDNGGYGNTGFRAIDVDLFLSKLKSNIMKTSSDTTADMRRDEIN
jgi:hypothetical protein